MQNVYLIQDHRSGNSNLWSCHQ